MSRELQTKHPDIRRYTTIWMDTLPRTATFQLANTNKLIRFYDGATGLKTGSTDSAKYCLSPRRSGRAWSSSPWCWGRDPAAVRRDAKALLNYGFSTYALAHGAGGTAPFPAIPVVLGETETVQPCSPQSGGAGAEKSGRGLSQVRHTGGEVEAPVSTGQELGTPDPDGRRRDGAVHPHPGGGA